MSSETILFDARWHEGGRTREERLVARIAPDADDVPVFPDYDLERQFLVIRLVNERTQVPVPPLWWAEVDASPIGAPFFVMSRVHGIVPPDVMPYNFGDSWLFDASPAEQRRLQDATTRVLAELHAIEQPEDGFAFLGFDTPGDSALERHVAHTRAWYEYVAAGGRRSPLVERAFGWLDAHWPSHEGPPVMCWGDSRIGNVMYDNFEPVAVLDWEMAALGPRELDVAWMIYGHRVFEDIAAGYGLAGMPEFMRRDDVATTYESHTGHALRDLDFYATYAAVQYAIVFLRTGRRAIHFGDRDEPDDIDELIMNREPLERMLAGTYWS
jgi:aminoglycoside phosphotransferase (APT) family kinase protein